MGRFTALPTITDDSALGGSTIVRSLRFNVGDSHKLTRTFGTNSSNTTKTISFWMKRGGFKSKVISTTKIGHVHFAWYGNFKVLKKFISSIKHKFFEESQKMTKNMNERGGGILDIEVINRADLEPNYYQLQAKFETCDAMGANFINSLLEKFSKILERELHQSNLTKNEKKIRFICKHKTYFHI